MEVRLVCSSTRTFRPARANSGVRKRKWIGDIWGARISYPASRIALVKEARTSMWPALAPACLAALGGSLTFLAGACRLRAGIRRTASRAPFRACRASIGGVRIRASGRPDVEGHDEAGFAGEDGQDIVDRHDDVFRHAVEPRLKLDHVVAHLQAVGGRGRDVEHDLAIAHISHGQPRATTGLHHQMRRIAVVAAPFVNSADQVGLGGNLGHRRSVGG